MAATLMAATILGSVACANDITPPPSTFTPTATHTPSTMPTYTAVPEPSPTHTRTPTATATPTPRATATPTPLPTRIPTRTSTHSPTATPTPTGPIVAIGNAMFRAEIADTPELHSKGLGERDSLDEQTGMLFIFPDGYAPSFWMFRMRFPLDFVWIGEDCTVVDLTENVQHYPPDTPSSELEIFGAASPAAYTFEINAGEASRFSIEIGDDVRFHGIDSEFAKCCESGVCNGK